MKKVRYNCTLYLEEEVLEKVKDIARKEKRKFANVVQWLLVRALEELPL